MGSVVISMSDQDDQLKTNVDRIVGFAVLRRLSKVAKEELAQEDNNHLLAKRISLILLIISVFIIAMTFLMHEAIPNILRTISSIAH
jgi:hypothetical protein